MTSTEGRYDGLTVAVLGASGFIGRQVVAALGRRGASVIAVVRDPAAGAAVLPSTGVRLQELDLAELDAVGDFLARVRPDSVFNLAGYGVDPAEQDEILARQLNAELVETLCACLAGGPQASGVRTLVHVGSAFEYGDVGGDLSEDGPARPTSVYGRTKLAGTRTVAGAAIDGLVARLFTVYGPGEHPHRLLPSLIDAARTGVPLSLTSGRQQRDFTHVGDVAEGLCRLGLSSGEPGAVVNLSSGTLVTVRRFAERAAAVLGLPAGLLRFGDRPDRPGEMAHSPVRPDRLVALTGWKPTTGIDEGVRRTLESGTLEREAEGKGTKT